MTKTMLTRNGYDKLVKELEYLRTVRRPEIAELLKDAIEGDFIGDGPDGGYCTLLEERGFVEGRILELKILLSNPEVIEECGNGDVVQVGATVTIQEADLDPENYMIVGPAEALPSEGMISYESPLGAALLGRSCGENVMISAPNGSYSVQILNVH